MSGYNFEVLKDYADEIPNSREGVEGRKKTARVIAYALYGMGLELDQALQVIREWNNSLEWSWKEKDLREFIGWVRSRYNPLYCK